MSSSSVNLDLDFQDYAPSKSSSSKPESQSRLIPSSPVDKKSTITIPTSSHQANSNIPDDVIQQLIWASSRQRTKQQRAVSSSASSSWGLAYFSQYFDVTTSDVLQRIIWSAIPFRKTGIDLDDSESSAPLASNMIDGTDQTNPQTFLEQLNARQRNLSYIERFIQSRPDFYGPFWISTTLVFAVAIFSNLMSFVNYRSKLFQDPDDKLMLLADNRTTNNELFGNDDKHSLEEWHYSIDELNTTASVIMSYVIIMPTFLWFLSWFRGCAKYYTLTETICAYGYSLSIFIPLAALLMIQGTVFRYFILLLASLLSGLVLMLSFVPVVKSDPNVASSHIILVMVPLFQVGLAYILHRIMLV